MGIIEYVISFIFGKKLFKTYNKLIKKNMVKHFDGGFKGAAPLFL